MMAQEDGGGGGQFPTAESTLAQVKQRGEERGWRLDRWTHSLEMDEEEEEDSDFPIQNYKIVVEFCSKMGRPLQ